MKRWSWCLSIGLTFLLSVCPCLAQNVGLKTFDGKGKLVEANLFQLQFKSKEGVDYTVYLDAEQSTVNYSGTADTKSLSPGLMVRFSGKFDDKGTAQSDLTELEIFSPKLTGRLHPNEELAQTPGIYPVGEDGKQGGAAEKSAPGKGTSNNAKDAKDSKDSKEATKSKGTKQKPTGKPSDNKTTGKGFQEYKVVGQITNVQGGKIMVSTGSQSLIVPIASSAKVKVSMPSAQFSMPNDEVHVVGLSSADQPTMIQARTVNIVGAKPIGANQLEDGDAKKSVAAGKGDTKKDGKSDGKSAKTGGKK